MKFKEFGFEEALLEGLDAMGFEKATPVQEQAIPIIMDQQDILAIAQTGTGKTAAFLLPVINRLTKNPTDGIDTFRLAVRGGKLYLDQTMSLTGFGGSKGIDYDDIFERG